MASVNNNRRNRVSAGLVAFGLALALAPSASAQNYIINVGAGSNWRTTTDVLLANQWVLGNFSPFDGVAATAPYGNTSTQLNENLMMWNCGADGTTGCTFDVAGNALGTGPNQTFYAFSFEVIPGSSITNGSIAIIADDFVRLFINGQNVLEAFLVDNLDDQGQPVPIVLDFATLGQYFQPGQNVISIGAEDLGGFEYLFVAGSLLLETQPIIVDVSAGSNWRTTTDVLMANQWVLGNFDATDGVAATAPYGNTSTTSLNPNRMMWNCGADGTTGCTFDASGNALGTGPDETFYAYSFDVHPAMAVTNGGIAIIADDFHRLIINGQPVHDALLADHLDGTGQPVPIVLDFATLSPYFKTGKNVMVVGAEDFAGFEYLFVSGSVQVEVVDEDFDLITDGDDNCILVPNAFQRDTNGDGYGNACDPDLDNNGVVNFLDVAMWVPFFNTPNTGDEDFNGDGNANFLDYGLFSTYFLRPPGPSGLAP